jgi:hypothetical protein
MKDLNSNITGFVSALFVSGDIKNIGTNFKPSVSGLGVDLGSAISSSIARDVPILGNITGIIGGAVDGIVSGLFGSTKKSFAGSGLTASAFELGSGIDLKGYTDVTVAKDGGWFQKTRFSNQRTLQDISDEAESRFQLIFTNLRNGMIEVGNSLGMSVTSLVDSFVVNLGDIATNGKTGAEIEQALQEVISTQSDKLAYAIFPDLVTKYAKLNEGYFETLIRLVTDKAVVESTLGDMGITLAMSADVIDVTQNLVKLSGTISDFASNSTEFIDKFYSDEQKFAITTRKVNDLFRDLNLEIPQSASALVDLVSALDLTTESGQKAFVSITKATGTLDSFYNGVNAAQIALDAADAAFVSLQKAIDAEKKSLQDAYNIRVEGLNTEKKALEETRSAMDAMSKALKTAYNTIFKTIVNPVTNYKQAQASLINIAASGIIPDQENLNNLLSVATANDTKYYSTFEDYARDQAVTGLAISAIEHLVDTELNVAKAQLLVIEDTLLVLKRTLDFDIEALDKHLSYYQKQLDALKGVDNQVLSVQAAIAKMESSLAASKTLQEKKLSSVEVLLESINKSIGDLALKLVEGFEAIDTNTDGLLTKTELSDAFGGLATDSMLQSIFNELDTNGDGTISRLEAINESVRSSFSSAEIAGYIDAAFAASKSESEAILSIIAAMKTTGTTVGQVAAATGKTAAEIQAIIDAATATKAPTTAPTAPTNDNVYRASGGATANLNTGVITSTTGNTFTISEAQSAVNSALAAGDPMSVYKAAVANGVDSASLDKLMGWGAGTSSSWAASQGLQSFAVGTNYIPHDMIAQVHKGEMIVPAKYNPATSGIQVNEALLEEIKALRQEVSELKAQDRQIGVQLIKSTVKTADYIEKWDSTGLKTEAV